MEVVFVCLYLFILLYLLYCFLNKAPVERTKKQTMEALGHDAVRTQFPDVCKTTLGV